MVKGQGHTVGLCTPWLWKLQDAPREEMSPINSKGNCYPLFQTSKHPMIQAEMVQFPLSKHNEKALIACQCPAVYYIFIIFLFSTIILFLYTIS